MYNISLEITLFSIVIIITAIIIDKFNNMGESFLNLQPRNAFMKPPLPQPKWLVGEETISQSWMVTSLKIGLGEIIKLKARPL